MTLLIGMVLQEEGSHSELKILVVYHAYTKCDQEFGCNKRKNSMYTWKLEYDAKIGRLVETNEDQQVVTM